MSTPAIQFLKQRRLPFEVVSYEHQEKGAEFAAKATGFPLARTVKTLVVAVVPKRNLLVLVPGDRQLDLKRLARALDAKKAGMADPITAERLTGYHVGGISPFGVRQALAVVMDRTILESEEVLINAGRRGVMLKMSPSVIRAGLNCMVAAVSD
ncbi:Cys-tRNA(Pro)/Cys-tRNA(Cys) deacylase YbaK [Anaerolineae bacterium]|nr:Cys-tRNA(Pro)/Cys-tRNA(Cys) deacylase YbaK [Anaerolineae bacterium]